MKSMYPPSKGPVITRVTITEWGDFECPFCAQARSWINEIMDPYPNDVRLVFKQFPLPMHRNAMYAAQASLAAHAQGKFWEMSDQMFDNYRRLTPENITMWAKEDLGLDMGRFLKDVNAAKKQVEREMKEGADADVQGTPTFFFNGKKYTGHRDLMEASRIIQAELATH